MSSSATPTQVGIHGIGIYLPPIVRRNDWWPAAEVDRWREQMAHRITRTAAQADAAEAEAPPPMPPAIQAVIAAMGEFADDPFRGAVERRVMPDDMRVADMEANAANDAIERAGVRRDEIDVVLGSTMCPDDLAINHACIAHQALGLRHDALVLSTEAICNAFALHLALAESMIRAGRARYVLLLHSSAMTRVQGSDAPHSAWFGDGAAAVIVGPVAPGRGLLAVANRADGTLHRALVLGVPGKRWWEDGHASFYAPDHIATRDMLLKIGMHSQEVVSEALATAGVTPGQVDFYASHQGTPWLTRVTAELCGLERARTVVTFPFAANCSSVNLPLILGMGEREGTLKPGDLVTTFAGGTGMTWSSTVLRWGR